MLITTIKTHKIKVKESIFEILDTYLPKLPEKCVIAIASKVISTCENRVIAKTASKKDLIHQESNFCFSAPAKAPSFCLTLKDHRLIPNGGIDESNCKNRYILLPQKPQLTIKKIWEYLCKKHHLKHLGVMITDSNITPLRSGVTGIAIGWCGFKPLYDYIGQKDLYGKTIKATKINLLDSLATTATLVMGEGKEQTPIAIIKTPPKIIFQNRAPTKKEEREIYIDLKHDLFSTAISYE